MVANGAVCFPFDKGYVRGTLSLAEDGSASATFTFSGLAQDGVTPTQYMLTLDGADPWDSGWPVAAPVAPAVASKSAFMVATWTLTQSSGKGKKRQGCSGSGSFPIDRQVRVELRHIAPTTVNPGTAPFLLSPFDLGVSHTMTLRFDHTAYGDGVCVDFRGADCGGLNGGGRYQWSISEGNELRAAADGRVIWASADIPFYCSTLGEIVDDQLFLGIAHNTDAADGKTQTFASVYKHVSTIVAGLSLGDTVAAGQLIGLSGSTGCSTEPNLQFSVRAAAGDESLDFVDRFRVRVDPYGWSGVGPDPSLDVLDKALNQLLWVSGQEPAAPPLS